MVEANMSSTTAAKDANMAGENNENAEETKNHQAVSSAETGSTDNQMTLLDAHANMRELTNLELIRKAEDCVDRLKLEKAVSLYDEGVRRFPNDTIIMD